MRNATLMTVAQLATRWHDDESEIEKLLEEGRAPKHITLPSGQVLFRFGDVVAWEDDH